MTHNLHANMDYLALCLRKKLALVTSEFSDMASSSKKSSPPSAKVTPTNTPVESPLKSADEQVVLVSPQGVKTIYEDVINKLNRMEDHARTFISNLYEMNLVSEMKCALTSDPPPVEMLLLFEKIAGEYSAGKRKRDSSVESKFRARRTSKYRPKPCGKLKGKKLMVPKVESSSSSDFASPLKKVRAFADDSSVEILGA